MLFRVIPEILLLILSARPFKSIAPFVLGQLIVSYINAVNASSKPKLFRVVALVKVYDASVYSES